MNINLYTWFSDREVEVCPKHFIKCNAPLTEEAKFWVYENLTGRFHIENSLLMSLFSSENDTIHFEDPQEAVMFELRWS